MKTIPTRPGLHKPALPEKDRDDAPYGDVVAVGAREAKSDTYVLRLYIAGKTPKSIATFANLKKICEENLAGRYNIQVIDLLENPQLARGDQILALPTLVRKLPVPIRKIIGDLSNTERVLVGLDLRPGA